MAKNLDSATNYRPIVPTITDTGGPPASDTSNSTGNWSTYHIQAPYGEYTVTVDYYWNNGNLQAPIMTSVSGTGTSAVLVPCKVITYCAPFGIKTVTWRATRTGFPPRKPDPNPTDSNLVLRSFVYSPVSHSLQADSTTRQYTQTGVYTYIMLMPLPPSAGYPTAAPDFDSTSVNALATEPYEFVSGII